MQLPLGSEAEYLGVIDLVKNQAIVKLMMTLEQKTLKWVSVWRALE